MCKIYIFKDRFTGKTRRVCGETLGAMLRRERIFFFFPKYRLVRTVHL